jgi:hypothetical protein
LSRSTTENGIVLKREVDVNTRIESESVPVMLLVASELNEGVRDVENVGEPRVTVIDAVSDCEAVVSSESDGVNVGGGVRVTDCVIVIVGVGGGVMVGVNVASPVTVSLAVRSAVKVCVSVGTSDAECVGRCVLVSVNVGVMGTDTVCVFEAVASGV